MSDKAGDGPGAGEDKKTSVMEDPMANKQMDALFAVIQTNPDSAAAGGGMGGNAQKAGQKKWKERELPPSFFDAGSGQGMNSPDKLSDPMKQQKPFPRLLGPSINLGPPQMPHAQHMRSASMPATLESLNHVPLPPGWEASKTPDGLTYYIE